MRIQFTIIAVLCLVLNDPGAVLAQSKWQSGLFVGGANYQGDLVETLAPYPEETNFGIGLINYYKLSPLWRLRGHFFFGKVTGSDQNATKDKGRNLRNFNFETTVGELAMMLEWAPFAMVKGDSLSSARIRTVSPYLSAGVGGARFDGNTSFETTIGNGFLALIEADKNAEAKNINVVFPVSGGIRFNLGKTWEWGIEGGVRLTLTDYLDGVSLSANPERDDLYWFAGTSIALKFMPKDSDRDGIADKEDNCPDDPGGLETFGCPDTDGDGIGDLADHCPNVFGPSEFNGCPDSDGDRIVDLLDNCPSQPGTEATSGCPDQDLDAIADAEDECPRLPGSLIGKGCPLVDLNGDGSIRDEQSYQRHRYLDASAKLKERQQQQYWWLKAPRIWSYIKW